MDVQTSSRSRGYIHYTQSQDSRTISPGQGKRGNQEIRSLNALRLCRFVMHIFDVQSFQ